MRIVLIIIILLVISGCSTYSKNECLEMDQAQIGYKNGINGANSFDSSVNHITNTCEKDYGIKADIPKIKKGWEDGIQFYCSNNGGLRAGSSGMNYTGVCSKENEKIFFETYNPARLGFLEEKVKQLEHQLESVEGSLSSCESEKSSLSSQLSSAQSNFSNCQIP